MINNNIIKQSSLKIKANDDKGFIGLLVKFYLHYMEIKKLTFEIELYSKSLFYLNNNFEKHSEYISSLNYKLNKKICNIMQLKKEFKNY